MAVKLGFILFAAIVVSTSFMEGEKIGTQEETSLEYDSNSSQREVIQGNIYRSLSSMK